MDPLEAATPIDGRYRRRLPEVSRYFSEYALMRARLIVETRFLEELVKRVEPKLESSLPKNWMNRLRKIVDDFSLEDARKVKEIEERVGHDVKALIDYMRSRLSEEGLGALSSFVHIGLTSEDVNNIAYSILLRGFLREVYLPELLKLIEALVSLAREHRGTVMLARTHGQPAAPTTLGRFIANYAYRAAELTRKVEELKFPGKLGGAVGDHAALKSIYPNVDWRSFSSEFVDRFGLEFFPASTQILPHDKLSELFSHLSILSSILSNLCRDLWLMGALGLLRFARAPGEVHSSTMPHKANPLYLENAEGALDLSSELLSFMARRLLSSRLHRDLSDSVIKRFYGVAFSTSLLGLRSMLEGLRRMEVDVEAMGREVEEHWEVLGEMVQVALRKHGVMEGYEAIQRALREGWEGVGRALERLRLPEEVRKRLLSARPAEYVGEAVQAADSLIEEVERVLVELRMRLGLDMRGD